MSVRFIALISAVSFVFGCEATSASTSAADATSNGDASADTAAVRDDVGGEPGVADVQADDDAAVGDDTAAPREDDVGATDEDVLLEDTAAAPDVAPSEDVDDQDVGSEPDEDVGSEPDVQPDQDAGPEPDAGPACVPDCDGKSCGPDGCGGECGSCDDGELCTLGLCSAPGACTNAADGGVLASIDVAAEVEGCAKGCILESDKAACGGACLAKETGLSADCAACFGGNVACAFSKCTFECGFGSAESCLSCQTTAGCFVAFESCAGLPPP